MQPISHTHTYTCSYPLLHGYTHSQNYTHIQVYNHLLQKHTHNHCLQYPSLIHQMSINQLSRPLPIASLVSVSLIFNLNIFHFEIQRWHFVSGGDGCNLITAINSLITGLLSFNQFSELRAGYYCVYFFLSHMQCTLRQNQSIIGSSSPSWTWNCRVPTCKSGILNWPAALLCPLHSIPHHHHHRMNISVPI